MTIDAKTIRLRLPDSEYENLFTIFLEEYEQEIIWVLAYNQTTAPYHSTRHLVGVAFLLWHLCKSTEIIAAHEKQLVIAGLLHDLNYLRSEDDFENIVASIRAAEPFFEKFPQYNRENIVQIITYTYFSFHGVDNPFISGGPVFIELHNAIREADQLYGTFFFDRQIFFGMYEEIGKRFNQSVEEFQARNVQYVTTRDYTYGTFADIHRNSILNCIHGHFKVLQTTD